MMAHFQKLMVTTLCSLALASHAQTPASAAPQTYPPDAQTPDAQQLTAHVHGKVFTGQVANGTGWRLEFQPSGYLFMDISNGARDNGPWSSEGGQLCIQYKGRFPSGCSEVRIAPQTLYIKRGTGEIVTLKSPN